MFKFISHIVNMPLFPTEVTCFTKVFRLVEGMTAELVNTRLIKYHNESNNSNKISRIVRKLDL